MLSDSDLAEIAQLFIEESREGLDIMESGLLNLDLGAADPETMNAIFRAAHSIKGGGATFGFTEVSEFAHQLETLLDEMRQGDRPVTREGVDLLLLSVDCIREMVEALGSGDGNPERVKELEAKLDVMLNSPADTAESPENSDNDSDGNGVVPTKDEAATANDLDGQSEWLIIFKPEPEIFQACNDPIRIFRELRSLGELEVKAEGVEALEAGGFDPESCHLSWTLSLKGDISQRSIEEAFAWVEGQSEITIECIVGPSAQPKAEMAAEDIAPQKNEQTNCAEEAGNQVAENKKASPRQDSSKVTDKTASAKTAVSAKKESASIRVNIDKVDSLVNLVGELVITQSMLSRFTGSDIELSEMDNLEEQLEELEEGLIRLSRNTLELQESVMSVRMMPISFAFSRFPRLVRDQSNALGKKVELKLSGEDTELDKTVLEKIGDPLVHLVRNSLDHGLENPETRTAGGKPETGVLELRAYHSGGSIVIDVIDDGAGINKEKVIAKAREKGLIGIDEKISDERAYNLIFEPGFSTADAVSDLSGRGVGMDVVRRNITDLGGSVSVKSSPGVGSTTTITLPLTLAILEGQLLQVSGETFVVPLLSIVETVQLSRENVSLVAGQSEVFELRNEYLPIIHLDKLFNIPIKKRNENDGLILVVEAQNKRVGILVDDLLEQQQVVIKSLEENFLKSPGISGATILGNGKVSLILDIPGVYKMFMGGSDVRKREELSVA